MTDEPVKTPDVYLYSDAKKNRKVGTRKKPAMPKRYQPTEQDVARKESFRKRV